MQRLLVLCFYSRLFSDGFQASIESWKLKADIDTICARLFRTKVILISVTRSLTPARYHKEITSTIVEQAVKVTARISNLVETETNMWRLYDEVKKLEQLLDIESFVRSETQAIFISKEELYSRYTELLERLTHILGLFEVFERSVLYSSSLDDSRFGIIKLQAAIPQGNRNQYEGEVDMQQSSTKSLINTAHASNLTAEGSNVTETKTTDSQKEVGDKAPAVFSQVQGAVITGGTFYSIAGDYMVSNLKEAPRLDSGGTIGNTDVVEQYELVLKGEIYKGQTYRIYKAERSGKVVAVQVHAGKLARDHFAAAARFYRNIFHPNIPLLIGVSPFKSESAYLVFNEVYEGTLAHVLGQVLTQEKLNQSLTLGVQTVMSFASGIDYLREQDFPFNSIELDDFVPMISYGKIVITFDPKQNGQGKIKGSETEGASEIFNGLCRKTFDSARKAYYENEHIISTSFDDEQTSDEDDSGDESAADDIVENPDDQINDSVLDPPRSFSSAAEASSSTITKSSSGTQAEASSSTTARLSRETKEPSGQSRKRWSRTSVQKRQVARKRHELAWRPAAKQVLLTDVSDTFHQIFKAFSSPSSSDSEMATSLRHHRYPARTSHKCQGYNLVEINLTADIEHSRIITHTTPTAHEICHICGKVVKSELNCECGNNDDESVPIIKCSNCPDWHHQSCVGLFGRGPHSFVCRRCKDSLEILHVSLDPRIDHDPVINTYIDKELSTDQDQPANRAIPFIFSPPDFLIKPRVYALIIGISQYKAKQISNIRGGEPDAIAFKAYLSENLRVPEDQITVLLNEQATRVNIVKAFREIATDPSIHVGNPIVIFYAGHAAQQEVGSTGVKTQMLIPYDFSFTPGEPMAITNVQIANLIGDIAANKGDNITVILDCDYSGSATRASAKGLKSHMLIAACGPSEQAKETNGRGNFTAVLLKLLKTYSPDKLRYRDILVKMDAIPGQNPQCEGKNQHRILFSTKVATPARTFLVNLGEPSPQGYASIIVEAGSVQGVTEGAEFALYSVDDLRFEEPLALATVKSVAAFTATLNHLAHFDVARACVAIQTKAGQKEDVRLYVPPGDAFRAVFKSVRDDQGNSKYDLHNITLVADQTIAHLKATVKEADMLLEMTDERVTRYGFSQLFKAVDIHDSERMGRMFSRIAHFYRELNRANSDDKLASRVHIEFYELEETDNEDFDAVGENLCNNSTIDLVVKEDIPYGMKLVNTSQHDLYPYLFWFDNTDLSINDCYLSPAHPNAPYTHDIPLPRRNGKVNSELTIGYGPDSCSQPFCFALENWQDLGVGFFKLFISTKPVDLSYIPQSSPFDINRGLKGVKLPKTDRWDTILIPVVQRWWPSP